MRIWKLSASSAGFRFVVLTGRARHESWIVVLGGIEPRQFGSRVSVRIRASLPEIVVFGLGSLFLPGAILGAAFVHGRGLAASTDTSCSGWP
jgi:hypothetical protein